LWSKFFICFTQNFVFVKNLQKANFDVQSFQHTKFVQQNFKLELRGGQGLTAIICYATKQNMLSFFRREKVNPVRTMLNTAMKITEHMGDPIMKKKKKNGRTSKKSMTLKPDRDIPDDVTGDEDDEVTPLKGNTPNLQRHHPAPGHLERSKTTG
jgi:hypothetical protein